MNALSFSLLESSKLGMSHSFLALAAGCAKTEDSVPSTKESDMPTIAAKAEPMPTAAKQWPGGETTPQGGARSPNCPAMSNRRSALRFGTLLPKLRHNVGNHSHENTSSSRTV